MIELLSSKVVAVYQDAALRSYMKQPPFHPSEQYPEYPFGKALSLEKNGVYDAVRNAFMLAGLDRANFGSSRWNPLGDIVRPGDKVVIKPNFVLDKHYAGGEIDCVITQPSVLRAICDYVYIALCGKGELVIADAPQANCDFDNLLSVTSLLAIPEFYRQSAGFDIPVYDLRQLRLRNFTDSASRVLQDGDPLGYAIVDMGENSSFVGAEGLEKIYGADFDRAETVKHHNEKTHEYCVSKTVLSADVILSVPKMKVHRKAGVTLNLKNLVGINGNKNYLPHFRVGLPADGGDEFPKLTAQQKKVMYSNRALSDALLAKPNILKDFLYKCARKGYFVLKKIAPKNDVSNVILGGDWSGNDTIWRTLLDLNKILLYADKNGVLQEEPQRRFLSIIDGIVGGENEGPLIPSAKPCGLIACGFNPLVTDMAIARLMGFSIEKIPKFRKAMALEEYVISRVKPEEIIIHSNVAEYETAISSEKNRFLSFVPAKGWVGSMEI